MTISLDTSVLVALFTPDVHTPSAAGWMAQSRPWVVTDWAAAEFSAAIRLKTRQGVVLADKIGIAEAGFDQFVSRLGGAVPILAGDHRAARELIIADGAIRAPDALHIVAARRMGAVLGTFDEHQARVAMKAGVEVFRP
ncbi:type II toxin-antitoxin system VapC family toxin [Brevundimonas sp.]